MTRLPDEERRTLLAIARAAVVARAGGRRAPVTASMTDRHAGAFVTLRIGDTLRGCIGHVEASRPLVETVRRVAAAAAAEDPRFPALSEDELARVVIEISVLGPLAICTDPTTIEVGRHGLVVEDGVHRGLLLPQVAVEWGWDGQTFLAQTCVKAGLRPDAWRRAAKIFTFEAVVFSEPQHRSAAGNT